MLKVRLQPCHFPAAKTLCSPAQIQGQEQQLTEFSVSQPVDEKCFLERRLDSGYYKYLSHLLIMHKNGSRGIIRATTSIQRETHPVNGETMIYFRLASHSVNPDVRLSLSGIIALQSLHRSYRLIALLFCSASGSLLCKKAKFSSPDFTLRTTNTIF